MNARREVSQGGSKKKVRRGGGKDHWERRRNIRNARLLYAVSLMGAKERQPSLVRARGPNGLYTGGARVTTERSTVVVGVGEEKYKESLDESGNNKDARDWLKIRQKEANLYR